MKAINADKLIAEMEKRHAEGDEITVGYVKQMPDVLGKIVAEIEALPKTYPFINHIDAYVKEDDVKKIIDKYKAENEE